MRGDETVAYDSAKKMRFSYKINNNTKNSPLQPSQLSEAPMIANELVEAHRVLRVPHKLGLEHIRHDVLRPSAGSLRSVQQ